MNKKCVASAYLPKHSSTKEFSVHELMLPEGSETIKVTISSTGLVCAKSETFTHQWIKCAKMAKGVHEQNAILVRSYGSTLMLDIVKDIKVDEEIFLWFSEEVQALMGISFLGLGNIQGENRYICTKCNKSFENPNPLKVHIALNCERYSSDILWRRLLESIDFPRDTSFFSNQLNYMSHYFNTINIQRHTMPHAATTHPKTFFNSIIETPPPPANSASPIHLVPQANANLETATHLETLVSNMGTSRNGHVCIYCGKLYSRKYGLKIHIRTHTGFKPLKCKFCLRPFGDPSNLNKHLRLHTQNGKETARYRCTICNKNLVRRRDLVRHVQAKHKLIHMEADSLSLSSMSDEDMDLTKDIEVSN
ncbi:PR domain zinc finger protein 13 [Culicoides brevitarsis]|uniref:PR domain zinc finger protein 13 n=1 Tax=Culicoides brevitarsis TaxID=469753 RepID=UPI00307C3B34